jgi:hypothetical protein
MDVMTLLEQMLSEGAFTDLLNNPLAQFGTGSRQYLGATILPERMVEENAYTEDAIRYRTVIANDGSRYSPAQKKESGLLIGSMEVSLGHQDIAREFTAREYDVFLRLLNRNATMDAMVSILNWFNRTVVLSLVELMEKQRWDAIVNATVVRKGDNGYEETVLYPDPPGHRITLVDAWSDDTVDPFEDIAAVANVMREKGYEVNRIITSRAVVSTIANNPLVRSRAGQAFLQVDATGALSARYGRLQTAQINQSLQADGLPPIETYDLTYRTEMGVEYFLPRDTMVLLATTGQDEELVAEEELRLIQNTLGYHAVGRAAGQANPGRALWMEAYRNKPPRIEAEAWQTSLPVINEPEAIATISGML